MLLGEGQRGRRKEARLTKRRPKPGVVSTRGRQAFHARLPRPACHDLPTRVTATARCAEAVVKARADR